MKERYKVTVEIEQDMNVLSKIISSINSVDGVLSISIDGMPELSSEEPRWLFRHGEYENNRDKIEHRINNTRQVIEDGSFQRKRKES